MAYSRQADENLINIKLFDKKKRMFTKHELDQGFANLTEKRLNPFLTF